MTCTSRVFKAHNRAYGCRIRCSACPLDSKQRHSKGQQTWNFSQHSSIPWKPNTTEEAQLPHPTAQIRGLRARAEKPKNIPITDTRTSHERLKRSMRHKALELNNAQTSKPPTSTGSQVRPKTRAIAGRWLRQKAKTETELWAHPDAIKVKETSGTGNIEASDPTLKPERTMT